MSRGGGSPSRDALYLPVNTFLFFGAWYAIGMVVFFGYSKNNTTLVEKAIAELRA